MHHPFVEHRPFGVTLIAILLAINGIVAIISAFGALELASGGTGAFLVGLVLGLVLLYVAYGMWTLQNWAWLATLIIEGLNALIAVLALLAGAASVGAWVSLIIAAVIVFYLTRPDVHGAFHGRAI